jgi:hypothetical protein
MTHIEQSLNHLSEFIKKYRELFPDDGDGIVECMQQVSPVLYYLEGERAKAHDRFQRIIHTEVLNGNSVSRAENLAHVQVPEMYQLRKVIDSAYVTIEAMRSQLAWIKTGLKNG